MARIVIEIVDQIDNKIVNKIREIGDTATDAEKSINILQKSIKSTSDASNAYFGVTEKFIGMEAKRANVLRESIRFLNEQNKALDERANKERVLAEALNNSKEISKANALKESTRFLNEQNKALDDKANKEKILADSINVSKEISRGNALKESIRFLNEQNEALRQKALLEAKIESSVRSSSTVGRISSGADKLKGIGGLNLGSSVTNDSGKFEAARLQVIKDGYVSLDKEIKKVNGSLFTFHNLFIAFAVIRIADKVVEIVDSYTLMENRLKLVSESQAKTVYLQNEIFKIANETRVPVNELTQSFVRYDYALKGLGATQQESLRFTKTLTETLQISGLTTAEQTSSLLQLSQALNKGKLDGDEFRTIMETLPTLATAIAKEMGVARGELIKLAPQGKITAEIIRNAMASIAIETDKAFQELTPTIEQSLTVAQNNIIKTVGEFNKFTSTSEYTAKSIIFLSKQLDILAVGAGIASVAIGVRYVAAMDAATLATLKLNTQLARNPYVLLAIAVSGAAIALRDYLKTTNEQDEETNRQNLLIDEAIANKKKLIKTYIDEAEVIYETSNALEHRNNKYKESVDLANRLVLKDEFFSKSEKQQILLKESEDYYNSEIAKLEAFINKDEALQIANANRIYALRRAQIQARKDIVSFDAGESRKEIEKIKEKVLKDATKETNEYSNTQKALNSLISEGKILQEQYNFVLEKTSLGQEKLKLLKQQEIKPDKNNFTARILEVENAGQKELEYAKKIADQMKLNQSERKILNDSITNKIISDEVKIDDERTKYNQDRIDKSKEISDASEKETLKQIDNIDKVAKADALAKLQKLQDIKDQSIALDLASDRINKGLGENSGPGAKADLAIKQAKDQLDADLSKNENALQEAKLAREKATAKQIADIDRKLYEERAQLAANLFGTLSGLAEKFAQGHGKRAKIAFEVSKGLAYAEAVLNMASAISKANATTGLYDKAVAIAQAVAVGANAIASIKQAEAPKFAQGKVGIGGYGTTTSDSMLAYVSRGESYINAASTSRHRNLLEAINADNGSSTSSINNTYLGDNQGGAKTNIIINNNHNGAQVEARDDGNGNIEIMVEQIDAHLAKKYADGNGKLAKAIDGKRLRNW